MQRNEPQTNNYIFISWNPTSWVFGFFLFFALNWTKDNERREACFCFNLNQRTTRNTPFIQFRSRSLSI